MNAMSDRDEQFRHLEEIYQAASLAPVFKRNPKHCQGEFANSIPYIAYGDVMDYKYIIRARPLSYDNNGGFDDEKRQVIVEYESMEALVDDGWRLD